MCSCWRGQGASWAEDGRVRRRGVRLPSHTLGRGFVLVLLVLPCSAACRPGYCPFPPCSCPCPPLSRALQGLCSSLLLQVPVPPLSPCVISLPLTLLGSRVSTLGLRAARPCVRGAPDVCFAPLLWFWALDGPGGLLGERKVLLPAGASATRELGPWVCLSTGPLLVGPGLFRCPLVESCGHTRMPPQIPTASANGGD